MPFTMRTDYQTLMGFNDIKANALNTHSALPRNCRDVYLAGNQVNGYYFIDGTTGTTETVFCDFTQSPSSRGNNSGLLLTIIASYNLTLFLQPTRR